MCGDETACIGCKNCNITTSMFICFLFFSPVLVEMDEHVDSCTTVFGWRRWETTRQAPPSRHEMDRVSLVSARNKGTTTRMKKNKNDKERGSKLNLAIASFLKETIWRGRGGGPWVFCLFYFLFFVLFSLCVSD